METSHWEVIFNVFCHRGGNNKNEVIWGELDSEEQNEKPHPPKSPRVLESCFHSGRSGDSGLPRSTGRQRRGHPGLTVTALFLLSWKAVGHEQQSLPRLPGFGRGLLGDREMRVQSAST